MSKCDICKRDVQKLVPLNEIYRTYDLRNALKTITHIDIRGTESERGHICVPCAELICFVSPAAKRLHDALESINKKTDKDEDEHSKEVADTNNDQYNMQSDCDMADDTVYIDFDECQTKIQQEIKFKTVPRPRIVFECTECSEKLVGQKNARLHYAQIHKRVNPKLYNCNFCNQSYVTKHGFELHLKKSQCGEHQHHADEKEQNNPEIKGNSNNAEEQAELLKHNEQVITAGTEPSNQELVISADETITDLVSGAQKEPPKTHNKQGIMQVTYECEYCTFIACSTKSFKRHLKEIHNVENENIYKCDICNKAYKYNKNLKSHRQKLHKEEIQMSTPNKFSTPVSSTQKQTIQTSSNRNKSGEKLIEDSPELVSTVSDSKIVYNQDQFNTTSVSKNLDKSFTGSESEKTTPTNKLNKPRKLSIDKELKPKIKSQEKLIEESSELVSTLSDSKIGYNQDQFNTISVSKNLDKSFTGSESEKTTPTNKLNKPRKLSIDKELKPKIKSQEKLMEELSELVSTLSDSKIGYNQYQFDTSSVSKNLDNSFTIRESEKSNMNFMNIKSPDTNLNQIIITPAVPDLTLPTSADSKHVPQVVKQQQQSVASESKKSDEINGNVYENIDSNIKKRESEKSEIKFTNTEPPDTNLNETSIGNFKTLKTEYNHHNKEMETANQGENSATLLIYDSNNLDNQTGKQTTETVKTVEKDWVPIKSTKEEQAQLATMPVVPEPTLHTSADSKSVPQLIQQQQQQSIASESKHSDEINDNVSENMDSNIKKSESEKSEIKFTNTEPPDTNLNETSISNFKTLKTDYNHNNKEMETANQGENSATLLIYDSNNLDNQTGKQTTETVKTVEKDWVPIKSTKEEQAQLATIPVVPEPTLHTSADSKSVPQLIQQQQQQSIISESKNSGEINGSVSENMHSNIKKRESEKSEIEFTNTEPPDTNLNETSIANFKTLKTEYNHDNKEIETANQSENSATLLIYDSNNLDNQTGKQTTETVKTVEKDWVPIKSTKEEQVQLATTIPVVPDPTLHTSAASQSVPLVVQQQQEQRVIASESRNSDETKKSEIKFMKAESPDTNLNETSIENLKPKKRKQKHKDKKMETTNQKSEIKFTKAESPDTNLNETSIENLKPKKRKREHKDKKMETTNQKSEIKFTKAESPDTNLNETSIENLKSKKRKRKHKDKEMETTNQKSEIKFTKGESPDTNLNETSVENLKPKKRKRKHKDKKMETTNQKSEIKFMKAESPDTNLNETSIENLKPKKKKRKHKDEKMETANQGENSAALLINQDCNPIKSTKKKRKHKHKEMKIANQGESSAEKLNRKRKREQIEDMVTPTHVLDNQEVVKSPEKKRKTQIPNSSYEVVPMKKKHKKDSMQNESNVSSEETSGGILNSSSDWISSSISEKSKNKSKKIKYHQDQDTDHSKQQTKANLNSENEIDGRLQCPQCKTIFDTTKSFMAHVITKECCIRTYLCNLEDCQETFRSKKEIKRHIESNHHGAHYHRIHT